MLSLVHFARVAKVAVIERVLEYERNARRIYALVTRGNHAGAFEEKRKVIECRRAVRVPLEHLTQKHRVLFVNTDSFRARVVHIPERRESGKYPLPRFLPQTARRVGGKLPYILVRHTKLDGHHEYVVVRVVRTVVCLDVFDDTLLQKPLHLSAVHGIACKTVNLPADNSVRFAAPDSRHHVAEDRTARRFRASLLDELLRNFQTVTPRKRAQLDELRFNGEDLFILDIGAFASVEKILHGCIILQFMYKLGKTLLKKSEESFLLALELYNKPTIGYRAESFCLLFSNAWELLLKARLLEQGKGRPSVIFHRKQKGKRRTSISLDEGLGKLFPNESDPVRKNVEYISEIRNEAAHLIIKELDPYFSRAFQVGAINYIDYLLNWFGVDINKRLTPGLVSLISDKTKISDTAVLKQKYSRDDFEAISYWIKRFAELEKLGDKATLSIEHTVVIVKNPQKADYVISSGDSAEKYATIIQKTKNPDISHPFNRTSAITEIRKGLPTNFKFNEYDFEAYVYCKGHKKTSSNDYYYKGRYSGSGQYSQQFVSECTQEVKSSENLLSECKGRYKKYLAKKQSR